MRRLCASSTQSLGLGLAASAFTSPLSGGNAEGERAALLRRALDGDVTSQQPGKLARHGEAQAGAATARADGFGLVERFEDPLHLIGRDADAAVLHLENDLGSRVHDAQADVAALRELDRV